MKAMVLRSIGKPLEPEERPDPRPSRGEICVRVEACAVCRTDLHVVDGDLPHPALPLIPGHEIVGRIEALGPDVGGFRTGSRVGVPWLGFTCGRCPYCQEGAENLCDNPQFTGYSRDGAFASHVIANAAYAFSLDDFDDPVSAAPLMCAGLIGWRALRMAGVGAQKVGLYGFGAAAHILAQLCRFEGRETYAFTRRGDRTAQDLALWLGAVWAGASEDPSPIPLDAAIIFAPIGALVPVALRAVRKGGRVICGGIHMSEIPAFPYALLWEERRVQSVANLTRSDARDFLAAAAKTRVQTITKTYALERANEALDDLRAGRVSGAAVLTP